MQRVSEKQFFSAFQLYLNHIEDAASKSKWFNECEKIWKDSFFKIRRLNIKDFRIIDQLDLSFNDKLTLIIGENGTGKSTVLDSLAKTLLVLTSSIKSKTASGSPLNERDIRFSEKQCDFFKIYSELELGQNNKISCVLAKARSGYPIAIKNSFQDFKLLGNAIQYLSENIENHLPIMVYYSIKRSEKMRPHDTLRVKKYKNRIFDLFNPDNLNGSLTFESFEEWYLRLNKSDGDDRNKFSLLTLVADLAKRLILSNEGSENPFNSQGIVLIDEIELHLHPQWQREILPLLMRNFPNIQFIVTTHSPQVISSVEAKYIRMLYCNDEKKIEVCSVDYETDGATSSEILNKLMGVVPRRKDSLRVQQLEKFIEQTFDLNSSQEHIDNQYEKLKCLIKNEDMLNEATNAKLALKIRQKLNAK